MQQAIVQISQSPLPLSKRIPNWSLDKLGILNVQVPIDTSSFSLQALLVLSGIYSDHNTASSDYINCKVLAKYIS